MDIKVGIGIDLGTTNSGAAFWKKLEGSYMLEMITTETGQRLTPSIVSFTDKEKLVGDSAKNLLSKNAENTIYDAKRLIGRKFSDECVQNDMKNYPFKIIKDPNSDSPLIEIKYKNKIQHLKPEEISAMVLSKIKVQIQTQLSINEIENVIITCPAYFNQNQRDSTLLAAKLAGLSVKRIINEPTAAAIAYGLNSNFKNGKNVLIFDLGGGTFDVTVLSVENTILEVKATNGDTHLGGEDFDQKLLEFCIKKFKEKNNIDLSTNKKALRRLKTQCIRIKHELSASVETSIEIESLVNEIDFSQKITRSEFEYMCKPLFEKCLICIENALKDAKMEKNEIEDIVLIGGSSRIPKVQEMVKKFFNGKELKRNIHPDEAVAKGAAIQAAICERIEDKIIDRLVLLDVTPLSLGFRLGNDEMFVLIQRNQTIPYNNSHVFYTPRDNTERIQIEVYQGERKLAIENEFLGKAIINLPKKPKGYKIKVTFSLDLNGILEVTACEDGDILNKPNSFTIEMKKNTFSDETIKKLVEEAKKWENEDKKRIESSTARNNLQRLGFELKDSNDKKVSSKGEELLLLIKNNPNEEKDFYVKKYKEYQKIKK